MVGTCDWVKDESKGARSMKKQGEAGVISRCMNWCANGLSRQRSTGEKKQGGVDNKPYNGVE